MLISQLESKIVNENEKFWSSSLQENFEDMTIANMKEMHRIMQDLKQLIVSKNPESTNSSSPVKAPPKDTVVEQKHDENDFLLFGGDNQQQTNEPKKSELNNGLEGLEDFF